MFVFFHTQVFYCVCLQFSVKNVKTNAKLYFSILHTSISIFYLDIFFFSFFGNFKTTMLYNRDPFNFLDWFSLMKNWLEEVGLPIFSVYIPPLVNRIFKLNMSFISKKCFSTLINKGKKKLIVNARPMVWIIYMLKQCADLITHYYGS